MEISFFFFPFFFLRSILFQKLLKRIKSDIDSIKVTGKLRPCLQGGRVTLVLGLPQQEGYPGTHTFPLVFKTTRLQGGQGYPGASCLVNALLGTTRLPGTTLFWLPKAKHYHSTDTVSELCPRKYQFLSQFVICLLWK